MDDFVFKVFIPEEDKTNRERREREPLLFLCLFSLSKNLPLECGLVVKIALSLLDSHLLQVI